MDATQDAFWGLLTLAPHLVEIILLSLQVSLTAALLAAVLGLLLALQLYRGHFFGKNLLQLLIVSGMGLPPIVVGLVIYVLLSRSGPFGDLNLLYTVFAMILAQSLIAIPIVAGLSRPVLEAAWGRLGDLLILLEARPWQVHRTLIWETRHRLLIIFLAGFGRVIGEVGATTIVGGNILHFTRTMTGAIRLEASQGDLPTALALGFVLIVIAFLVVLLTSLLARVGGGKSVNPT